jgi:MFS family permease
VTSLGLLLRRREFGLVWSAGLISMIGDWILWIALPISVFELTGSAFATGLLVACRLAPEIVFGSVAGVFVDRWDRRRVLVAANVVQAIAILPLLLLGSAETVWIAYPVIAVSAVLFSFTDPAESAYLPRLVDASELAEANALNSLNNSLARLVGPATGGLLYLVGGLGTVAVVDALTFFVGAALIAATRTPGVPEGSGEREDAAGAASHALVQLAREWLDGLRAIRSSRVVSVLLGANALTAVGEGVFAVMFLVWVERTLLGGALEYGWLMSGQAIGGVAGGLIAGWLVRQLPPERMYGVGLVAFGFFDALLFNYPLLLSGVALGVVLIAIVGVPGVAAMAARQTLIQTNVPDRYLGRVFSALGTTTALLMLGSTLVAGAVGDRVSPIALLNVQAAGFLLSGVGVLWLLRPRPVAAPAAANEPRPGLGAG